MRQAGGEHPCVTQGRETAPTRSCKSPAWRTHTAADGAWLARRRLSIADSSCRTWGGFPPRGSLHQRPRPSGAWSVERGREHRPPNATRHTRRRQARASPVPVATRRRARHGSQAGQRGRLSLFTAAPGDPNRSRCSRRRNLPTLVYSRLPYLERGEFREGQSAGGAGQAVATLPRAGGRDRATCGRLSQPGTRARRDTVARCAPPRRACEQCDRHLRHRRQCQERPSPCLLRALRVQALSDHTALPVPVAADLRATRACRFDAAYRNRSTHQNEWL